METTSCLLTFGHGTASPADLTDRLRQAGVQTVVDVRRFPGSRRHPELAGDAMRRWLPDAGIGYCWEEHLGGRRYLRKDEAQPDSWWTVAAFRAYAAYSRTTAFSEALERVLGYAAMEQVAIMCSESVWWRCHRRLIADVSVLERGFPVSHLMPDGRIVPHKVAEGARLHSDGLVYWDGN